MKILLFSATNFEIEPITVYLNTYWNALSKEKWQCNHHEVQLFIAGVGSFNTLFALMNKLSEESYDVIIQAGIGGSYHKNKSLGKVYFITSERFGDIGIEEKNGSFTSIFETKLIQPEDFPFSSGILKNPYTSLATFLPFANGFTLNTVTGTNKRAKQWLAKFPDIDIENMEGAPFFYVCLKKNIPFISIRSISNYVEDRDKEKWKLQEAIISLNEALKDILEIMKNN
jgi:futalosine hydrolase